MENNKLIEILDKNSELHSKQIESIRQLSDIVFKIASEKSRNNIEDTKLKMATIISTVSAGNFYLIGLVMFMLSNQWAFIPVILGVGVSVGAIRRIYDSNKTS